MSALKPNAVDTHTLGTSALPWQSLHADALNIGARATGANVPTLTEVTIGSSDKLSADPSVPVNVEIFGSLTVHGAQTTISSSTLEIADLNITVAQGAADSSAANGAGLVVDGASASLLYSHSGTQWEFNKPLEIAGSVLPETGAKATADLGSATLPWNDLHLSSAGVINFDNGNMTATHSAGLLAIAGGPTRVAKLEIDSASDHIDVDTDMKLTASAGITLDAVTDIVLDADGDDITFKAGTGDATGLKWSQSGSGDWTNLVGAQDKDLIFQVNDGGSATEVMRLDGDVSSLLMAGTKKITFGDAGSFVHQSADGKLAISSDGAAADAVVVTSSNAAGGIDIDAGTGGVSIDSTGAFSIDGAAASNISVATDSDAEDLSISVTGDTNSSLVLSSTGTAADALSISTSAGGMDITVAGAAAGEDLDITSNTSININATETQSNAITLLATNGGIMLDSALKIDINSTGGVINIGNQDNSENINIGTDGDRTINIGVDSHSNTIDLSAQTLTLDAGTSGFTIDGAAASSISTSDAALTVNGKTGLNLQEDGTSVITIDTNRDVLFSQTGGSTGDPDVEFDGYVRFDGSSEFDGSVQVDGNLTANNPVSVQNTLTVGVDDAGFDVQLFGNTTGKHLLWDASLDELLLKGTTKLCFNDDSSAGAENIFASADGHLEVNAGTTLDMTAPTVDINASTAVTVESATFTLGSVNVATDLNPTLTIQRTGANTGGGTLKFVKDKGAAGASGDDAGVISFFADNAAQQQTEFARITAEVQTATDSEEGGKLTLSIAEHNGGTPTAGLVLTEGSAEGIVNVAIGAGTGSTTTIAGNLTVNGTTTTVNSTTLQVDDKNIELGVGSADDAAADGGGIILESGDGNKTFLWVDSGDSWTSSEDLDLASGKHFSINGTTVLTADGAARVQSGVAGVGLAHDGAGVLSVGVDGSSIEIDSDALRVKALGISNAMLGGSIANAKLTNSSIAFGDGSGTTSVVLGGTVVIQGTTDEVEIVESSGTFTVGLPNDVTINGDLTVDGIQAGGNISTTGNISSAGLTATGASIRFNDTLLQLGNNNSSTKDHGFYSERGSNSFVGFVFDESNDEFRCFTSANDNFGSDDNTDGSTSYALAPLQVSNLTANSGVSSTGVISGKLRTSTSVPASDTASGTAGDIAFDSGHIYICVATNQWKRAALTGGF